MNREAVAQYAASGRPVSQYILLLILSVLLPALVLAGVLMTWTARLDAERVNRAALQISSTVAAALEREFEGSVENLIGLANSPSLVTGDLAKFYEQAKAALALRGRYALLSDTAGQQVLNTRVTWGTQLPKADKVESWMKPVIEAKQPFVSDLVIGAVAKKWVLAVGVPVLEGQTLKYVLAMSVDPEHIHEIVLEQRMGQDWVIIVTDSAGRIVTRSSDHEQFVGQINPIDPGCGVADSVGRGKLAGFGDQDIIRGHTCLARSKWRVSAFVPADLIEEPLNKLWRVFAAASGAFLLASLPIAYLVGRQIAGPVAAAARAATSLGRGEIVSMQPSPLCEANEVNQALVEASIKLAERTRSLAESQARFRAVYDQAAVGFEQYDLDGKYVGLNDRLCSMLGFTREECLQKDFRTFTHPDDLANEEPELKRLLAGESDSYIIEKRLIKKSGEPIWVRITSSLVRDGDGKSMYRSSVVEDVTQIRKERLEAAQLATIVSASPDAMISLNTDGSIQAWNPGATALFGFSADEATGKPILSLVLPNHQAEVRAAVKAVLSGETIRRDTVKLHKDGTPIDVSVTLAPIKSGNRVTGISVTMTDVRERRKREALIAMLNRELAHRVKNSLAVVQAIANQTLRTTVSSDEFRVTFQGRLQALASATDLLTHTNWEEFEFSEFVEKQLSQVLANTPRQLRKSGPRVTLPPDLSVPIGLALYELGTNAIKYGAWSVPNGYVELTWRVIERPERRLIINWSEHQGPAVNEPLKNGFGSTLIDRGIPRSKVVRSFDRSGFSCEINITLDASAANAGSDPQPGG